MQVWEGPECLITFYELQGGLLLMDTIHLDKVSSPSTAEAAASALQAVVRRDPTSAGKAKQVHKAATRSSLGGTSSSGQSPINTSATSSAPTMDTSSNQDGALQLRLSCLVDLMTKSCPAVQTHIVTVLGLLVPCMNIQVISEVLDCGLIFMLCSLYVSPPSVYLRIAAIRTTNALLSHTLKGKGFPSAGSSILKSLLAADVCDVITLLISNFSVGNEIDSRKEELLEAVTLLETLAIQPSTRDNVSHWSTNMPNSNSGDRPSRHYPVTAADVLLGMLVNVVRTEDDLLNRIIVKICETAVHVATHCASRTLLLNGTSFAASCIEIACESHSEAVAYHALVYLAGVAYLPSFARPLLLSHRHIRLCERALYLAVPNASNFNSTSPSFFRSASDVVLYVLYQTSSNSALQAVVPPEESEEKTKEEYLSWENYALFMSISQNESLWANLAKVFRGPVNDVPPVALKIIHVLASYKDLEVLETLWSQLLKFGIPQLLLHLASTLVWYHPSSPNYSCAILVLIFGPFRILIKLTTHCTLHNMT